MTDIQNHTACYLHTEISLRSSGFSRQEVYKNNSDMDLVVIRLTGSRQGWEIED